MKDIMKRGSEFTMEWLIVAILVIVFAVGFFTIMGKMQATPNFWYAGCKGEIDGLRCFYYNELCGVPEGKVLKIPDPKTGEFTKETLRLDDKVIGIIHPRCSIYTERGPDACNSTYKMITKDGEKINFCVWIESKRYDFNRDGKIGLDLDGDGNIDTPKEPGCVENPEIICKDLSQETEPRCSDVPRCEPVSAIQQAIGKLPKKQ